MKSPVILGVSEGAGKYMTGFKTDVYKRQVQSLEVQTLPVCGVDAVDVADAGSQEVDAQSGDLCALLGISNLSLIHI